MVETLGACAGVLARLVEAQAERAALKRVKYSSQSKPRRAWEVMNSLDVENGGMFRELVSEWVSRLVFHQA